MRWANAAPPVFLNTRGLQTFTKSPGSQKTNRGCEGTIFNGFFLNGLGDSGFAQYTVGKPVILAFQRCIELNHRCRCMIVR